MVSSKPNVRQSYVRYNQIRKSMFLNPVTANEIIHHIGSLQTPGVDEINVRLIKKCHLFLIELLKRIFNLMFQTTIIPQ